MLELRALAIAGVKRLLPVPTDLVGTPILESRKTELVHYVNVLLDLVVQYYWRAEYAARKVPAGARYPLALADLLGRACVLDGALPPAETPPGADHLRGLSRPWPWPRQQ